MATLLEQGTRRRRRTWAWLLLILPLAGGALGILLWSSMGLKTGDRDPSAGDKRTSPERRLAERLVTEIARPFPGLQKDSGRYRSSVNGGTRYGDTLLGYGIIQAGLRADDRRLVTSGLRAVTFGVSKSPRHSRPSVFENLAVAGAYNLGIRRLSDNRRFRRVRTRWEQFLQTRRLVRLQWADYYGNHSLVEAVAVLEMMKTGLRSTDPQAILGGRRRMAIQAAERLINQRIPAMAERTGVRRGSERSFLFSDPPDNPLAYQGLSLGLYARAVDLLGRRAKPQARRTLRQVARASWELAAPDGDVAYFGRSQEQVWALAATAYGAAVTMRLPGTDGRADASLRALIDRTLGRLDRDYGHGEFGLNITPSIGQDRAGGQYGIDGNAGGPSFAGITLVQLNWAIPKLGPQQVAKGTLASDANGGRRLSVGVSRFAVVRRGNVWFAVRSSPSRKHGDDLRYDFGLAAIKVRRPNGRWVDAMPLRPITEGLPDSAGPLLRLDAGSAPSKTAPGTTGAQPSGEGQTATPPSGATATPSLDTPGSPPPAGNWSDRIDGTDYIPVDTGVAIPYGERMQVGADGTVRVVGGFRTPRGQTVRTGVLFLFQPVACGVRMSFPRRPGDAFQVSAFFPEGDAGEEPSVGESAVTGGGVRVGFSPRANADVQDGYHSAANAWLFRARVDFHGAKRQGRARVKFCAES